MIITFNNKTEQVKKRGAIKYIFFNNIINVEK